MRPVFVYATLSGRLVVYTDVADAIPSVPALTLMDVLRRRGHLAPALSSLDARCDLARKRAFRARAQKLVPGGQHNNPVRSRALVRAWQAQLLHDSLYPRAAAGREPAACQL